jgi:hypothetical protein
MRDITNGLRRQLEAMLKKQKGSRGTMNVGRMIQLSFRDSDPELAATIPPPTPDEQAQLEELAAQMDAMPRESIDEQLERLIAEIPNLPDAASADAKGGEKPEYGLKELPKPAPN